MTCDACKTLGPDSAPHPGLRFVWTGKIGGSGVADVEITDWSCDWCGTRWAQWPHAWHAGFRVAPPFVK